jgi:hypothetical protein
MWGEERQGVYVGGGKIAEGEERKVSRGRGRKNI